MGRLIVAVLAIVMVVIVSIIVIITSASSRRSTNTNQAVKVVRNSSNGKGSKRSIEKLVAPTPNSQSSQYSTAIRGCELWGLSCNPSFCSMSR